MPQLPGARWQTKERHGASHREAGRQGGRSHEYRGGGPGLGASVATRQEVAMRWFMGEATQAELAEEYQVARSTVRRWVQEIEPNADA